MKSELFTGRYLFHMHTTYTDGQLEVGDFFRIAKKKRLARLIFLEHIRKSPRYSIAEFIKEIEANANESGVEAHVGFETKILPDGTLDISKEDLERAEVIGIAEHGFPDDSKLYFKSLRTVLSQWGSSNKEIVWVHPGLWLRKHGLMGTFEQEHVSDLQTAGCAGIRLEHNHRYDLVSQSLLAKHRDIETVVGSDAHTAAELSRFCDSWLATQQSPADDLPA